MGTLGLHRDIKGHSFSLSNRCLMDDFPQALLGESLSVHGEIYHTPITAWTLYKYPYNGSIKINKTILCLISAQAKILVFPICGIAHVSQCAAPPPQQQNMCPSTLHNILQPCSSADLTSCPCRNDYAAMIAACLHPISILLRLQKEICSIIHDQVVIYIVRYHCRPLTFIMSSQ